MEGVSSEFDYFAPQTIFDTIEYEYDVAVPAKTVTRAGPLEFQIPGQDLVYRDLNNSVLEISCKVTQADETDLAANTAVAPVNLLLHALIKSADVCVNGRQVNDSNKLYAERAYLETVLSNEKRVLETRGICEGWVKDNASRMDTVLLATANGVDPNSGFVVRAGRCATSRVITLAGRLHCDLFHQPLDIPAGVPIEIKLALNEDKKILMAARDAGFKLEILSAQLLVRSKKLSPSLALAHERVLAQSHFRIPYTRVCMKSFVLPQGTTSISIHDAITGPMPSRVTLCMVTTTAQAGAYDQNPFRFQNFSLESLGLKVNELSVPHEPMKMNYATNNYTRAYLNTLASLGLDQGERALEIAADEWASGCNVYAFKLTPGTIGGGLCHASNLSAANISIEGQFANALAAGVTVIAHIEYPALLEIDSLKKVVAV